MEKRMIVRRQWFPQNGQGEFASCVYVKSSRSPSPIKVRCPSPARNRSLVRRAVPMAPMIPGYGARTTSLPIYCSMARRTASFRKVPPCTTIFSPRLFTFSIRMTLVNTFSMMERQSPAMMSAGFFPFRCSVMMLLFINTVQRLPSTAGFSEENAASVISFTGICSEDAKFSRKEPHPEEQASLTTMLVMMP